MKIGVIGCGALGSYYGAMLARAGAEVHFLTRSDYVVVRDRGVRLISPSGDFEVRPICARRPEEISHCDLVLIGLKTTANHEFARLVPPLVGPQSLVLTLQNGLGNEEALAKVVDAKRVLGGLCFVCLNRVAPGVIRHSGYGHVLLGEFGRPPHPRTHELAALFVRSGVKCSVVQNIEEAHWEKLVWNIPFNGLGTASAVGYDSIVLGRVLEGSPRQPCRTTDQLLDNGPWEQLVCELMSEVIRTAQAIGFGLGAPVAAKQVERTRSMGAYKASTLIDFEHAKPLEMEAMFLNPLRQARACGVETPRLAALCSVLESIDPGRGSSERDANTGPGTAARDETSHVG